MNCSLGAEEMRPHVAELARLAGTYTACHPNAGLPNAFGGYDQTPEETAALLGEFAGARAGQHRRRLLRHHAGAHRADRRGRVRPAAAPACPPRPPRTRFSGLEPFAIGPDTGFVMIGERTNVTGSARFRRLIEADDYQAAVDVALEQVRGGANLLDVNMDADLLDSEQAMTTFLNLIATEPEVARIPVMIDSSRWSVLEAGLKCVQGKGVVNSISLKEGEEPFLEQARRDPGLRRRRGGDGLRRAGPGRHRRAQGGDLRPRLRPADPARPGSPPRTSSSTRTCWPWPPASAEHNGYAKAFIEALPLIKERCPGARTSGGISNLSFSFRGNDVVREAMHSAFLFHAVRAGLDMGIVNAGQLAVYQDIPADLLELVEDVLFDRRAGRHRPAGRLRRDGQRLGDPARRSTCPGARRRWRSGFARAGARHRRLHRGRHRGGPAAGRARPST